MTNAHFGSDDSITDFLALGRGRSHNGNLRVGGHFNLDPTLQDFSCRGAEDRRTSVYPKNFRYLNFGMCVYTPFQFPIVWYK